MRVVFRRYPFLPVLAVAAGACASISSDQRVDRAFVQSVVAGAADQVKRCYRRPRVPSHGRQIVTHLRVRFAENGTLIGLPELVAQDGVTDRNRAYAAAMAEAAIAAVLRCSPIVLAPERRTGPWLFHLTFSLATRA